MQRLKQSWTMLQRVFTGGLASSDAWIDTDAPLTEREADIRRMSRYLQWAALVSSMITGGILLLLAFGMVDATAMSRLLLGGYDGTAGSAVLIGMVAMAANTSLLMLAVIGTQAQERWVLVMMLLAFAANLGALALLRFIPAVLALLPLSLVLWMAAQNIRAFHGNPVMMKELRGRMRGVRSFAIITIFLLLMGSFIVLLYLLQLPRVNTANTIITGELGRLLFIGVVGVELALIIFIVPALTAGAITGERERKTYDLLQTTLLSAPSFLMGKLESALGYIVLLLLSAIPLQSIAFIFGGISQIEVLLAFVLLMASALALGGLGMFFSALTDRTLTATIRVYMVALALIILPYIVSGWLFGGAYGEAVANSTAFSNVANLSPLQEAVTIYGDMFTVSLSPVLSAFRTQQMLIDQQQIFIAQVQLATDGSRIPVVAPWLLTSILYIGLMALLLQAAVRRLRRS